MSRSYHITKKEAIRRLGVNGDIEAVVGAALVGRGGLLGLAAASAGGSESGETGGAAKEIAPGHGSHGRVLGRLNASRHPECGVVRVG